jgi:transposase
MTNPYITALRVSGAADPRWPLYRELRRYEVGAKGFRDAGFTGLAELFAGYVEQTRLEIEALAKVDQRIADLDDELVTASAIDFGGPLPGKGAAA